MPMKCVFVRYSEKKFFFHSGIKRFLRIGQGIFFSYALTIAWSKITFGGSRFFQNNVLILKSKIGQIHGCLMFVMIF